MTINVVYRGQGARMPIGAPHKGFSSFKTCWVETRSVDLEGQIEQIQPRGKGGGSEIYYKSIGIDQMRDDVG